MTLSGERLDELLSTVNAFYDGEWRRVRSGLKLSVNESKETVFLARLLERNGISNQTRFLEDLERMLNVAAYVRSGGVKAMIYRLETGWRSQSADMFDEISKRFIIREGKLEPDTDTTVASLLDNLKSVGPEEEAAVKARLRKIDELVVHLGAI